jgi:hypothetical protein
MLSEANEGSLAHLLGEPVGVVAHPALGPLREEIRLAQPDSELLDPLAVDLNRRRRLRTRLTGTSVNNVST